MTSESIFTKLGKVVEIHDNRRIPLSSMERLERPGPYPYHGATKIMDFVDDFIFEGLHLLLAEDGSVLNEDGSPVLQLVDGKFWVNNHAHVLRGSDDIDTHFLYYALSIAYAAPWVTGAVQLKINQKSMNEIEINYPTRIEREFIVKRLKLISDCIRKKEQLSTNLHTTISALFRSWFIDFDPVEAKAEGKLPYGMDEETAALFPDSFEDSEYGPIPCGWGVTKVSELCKRVDYGFTATSNEDSIGSKFLRITDIVSRQLNWDSVPYCQISDELLSKYRLEHGDIVIARTAHVGVAKRIQNPPEDSVFASYLVRIKPKYDALSIYLGSWLESKQYLYYIQGISYGAGAPQCSAKHLVTFDLVLPPVEILNAFNERVKSLLELQNYTIYQINCLANTRDALLPRLMSGELKVPTEA